MPTAFDLFWEICSFSGAQCFDLIKVAVFCQTKVKVDVKCYDLDCDVNLIVISYLLPKCNDSDYSGFERFSKFAFLQRCLDLVYVRGKSIIFLEVLHVPKYFNGYLLNAKMLHRKSDSDFDFGNSTLN